MSLEKRRQFVEIAYDILINEGPEEIKIRRLAKEMDCTSPVVYRYFDNLDHLIALASVRLLNSYIIDFRNMFNDPRIQSDPYALNLYMWERLARHAFRHAPIYENLFFGRYSQDLGDVIYEYYELFLDTARHDFDGYSVSILFNGNIYQRDEVLLRRAATVGSILPEDVSTLSQLECHIFRGLLLKYADTYKDPAVQDKAVSEFMTLLVELSLKFRRDR